MADDKTTDDKSDDQKQDATLTAVQAGVAAWVDATLRNTAFSRDTESWNVLQGALLQLPDFIRKEIN